jgi:hypothetical protein
VTKSKWNTKAAGLPDPTIPIFEAMELKRAFLLKKLKSINLPPPSASYYDSEKRPGPDKATLTYEWTGVALDDMEEYDWFSLSSKKDKDVSATKLKEWAKSFNNRLRGMFSYLAKSTELANTLIDYPTFVLYAHNKCDYNRLVDLLTYLPKRTKQNSVKVFDAQRELIQKLFTKDPAQELLPNAPIYLPSQMLSYIISLLTSTFDAFGAGTQHYHRDFKLTTKMGNEAGALGK